MLPTFKKVVTFTGCTLITACSPVRTATVGAISPMDPEAILAGAVGDGPAGEARTESFALDRIAKRAAQLTGTVRRTGTGRGVAIYVFDGGVAAHAELAGRVRLGFDAFPGAARVCDSHGLAVASAAAGKTLGVAPDAEIVDVKIMNCARGTGTVEAILAAAQWAVEDHRKHPRQAAVANWSFVVDTTTRVATIDSAVALLRNAGMLVVASAGNADIDACRVSPANSGRSLVVGAASLLSVSSAASRPLLRDVRTANTAWGDCVDVYAPGELVPLPSVERGKATVTGWTGTSMAAGYVSGAASLVLEQFPTAEPDDVSRIIMKRATPSIVDEGAPRAPNKMRKPLLYVGPVSQVSRG